MAEEIKTMPELLAIAGKNKATLLDFYASWCGPCKKAAPYFKEQVAKAGVPHLIINADEAEDISKEYSIESMPTFIVIDSEGKVLFQKTGGSNGNIDAVIEFTKTNN